MHQSEDSLTFWVVHFCRAQLPYNQGSTNPSTELSFLRTNAAVNAIRDEYFADLVVLVGNFPGTCGLG